MVRSMYVFFGIVENTGSIGWMAAARYAGEIVGGVRKRVILRIGKILSGGYELWSIFRSGMSLRNP